MSAERSVPRYYFDTCDGDDAISDDEGIDLPDAESARRAAIGVLPDMARDKLPDGDRRIFAVSVRDADGSVVYSATLALTGEWQVQSAGS
ncbi:hypothetical protein ABID82_001679 [Methylobacterium sp. PvP062]|jgi:hypothetical protein|uniref:DUF6894 domain-containing protein n=1 Tax=Methylobacterium radiotolerans TaxID=31998 RepID=A0ABV2NBL2_9HYPH|nr:MULTISPECIES: hypothetical protein [Methylobacterium]MBP2492883.1 hypothetical protein [Methylobacterium sp. PvP105]MBP2500745.1 hypothetical protein [Methylobacterium sp. PvP109]MCX7333297.1 hypothetical protein [Hyphomicrobiales bacterium]GAN46021.1 hypothetical protein ME121_0024 [Methylobacterium sp. ME121]